MKHKIFTFIKFAGLPLFLFVSFSCIPNSIKLVKETLNPDLGNKCIISGYILDKDTQEPLIGAKIFLNNNEYETSTNVDGLFTFKNLSAGIYKIKAEYVGYKTVSKLHFRAKANYVYELNIELELEADLL